MKTINKILLLTDFSEVANNAARYATIIAKQVQAEIEILHIVNAPVDWVKLPLDKENLYPEIKAETGNAKTKLSNLLSEISKQGIKASKNLVFNMGVENISQYIKVEKYDLIIMGSHGAKGIKEFAIGSNVQNVIRNTMAPVLAVKTPPKSDSFSRIVMASTFEENQKPSFKHMINFASDLEADTDLLYINTPYHFKETEEIEKMLTIFCEDSPNMNCGKHYVDALNEERGIQFYMNQSNADLFTIATTRKSQFSRLFSSSLSEAVIKHLDIPVLVFHAG